VYPELEMFAPFSPEENGIRGYPQGYGIRENALNPKEIAEEPEVLEVSQRVPLRDLCLLC